MTPLTYVHDQRESVLIMKSSFVAGDVVRAKTSIVAHMWRTEKDKRLRPRSIAKWWATRWFLSVSLFCIHV